MSGNFTEILIDTDVLLQHVTCDKDEDSDLEFLLSKFNCFTTAINASEIFYHCVSDNEKEIAQKLLNSMKVLGYNSRYSLKMFGKKEETSGIRDAMIAVVAEVSKLPFVSYRKQIYKNWKFGVFTPSELRG